MRRLLFLYAVSACITLFAATYPGPKWIDAPSQFADPRAIPGGEFRCSMPGGGPKSLNYYLDNNTFSAAVFGLMFETLLSSDPVSAESIPCLAKSWTVSDDGRVFTFTIDQDAFWSDGTPVTADDVVWTFNQIMNPANMCGVHKMILEPFEQPEVLNEMTVRFTAKESHWRNLQAVGGISVLPKHAFDGIDFNKINFDFPVVSGPYKLGKFDAGRSISMERRSDWWGRAKKANQGLYNFQTLKYLFFSENENAFEAFKKDELDMYTVYTARIWAKQTSGDRYENSLIVKQRIRNHAPIGFQGFAMNLRRPPYNDVRVRKALAHLLDREKLNRTLMYRQYFMQRSYFEDLYDNVHPCNNPVYDFNPAKALELLAQAGWDPDPETGLLSRDGTPLVVRFLSRGMSTDNIISVYREDLKRVGITLDVDRKDTAAWAKDIDSYNFDMTWAAWSGGLFKDPESLWHSAEALRDGGNNITGFSDPKVDELIERQKTIFEVSDRNEICREIDRIITEACPYVLLWNTDSTRILYWNRFGIPSAPLGKFGGEEAAQVYWWFDPASDADLNDSVKNGLPLPAKPMEVDFDRIL